MLYSSPKFIKITFEPPTSHCPEPDRSFAIIFLDIHFNIILGPDPDRSLHSPCQISCPIPIPFIVPKDQSQSAFCGIFRNTVSCYDVQLLAPRPSNKLQFTIFSFSILTAFFPTWKPSPTYQPEVWPLRPVKDAFTSASDTLPLLLLLLFISNSSSVLRSSNSIT